MQKIMFNDKYTASHRLYLMVARRRQDVLPTLAMPQSLIAVFASNRKISEELPSFAELMK